jgi:hypothetical protein
MSSILGTARAQVLKQHTSLFRVVAVPFHGKFIELLNQLPLQVRSIGR